jgi:hypothetical protein
VSRKEKFKSKKTKKQKGRAGAPTYNPSYSGGGSGGSLLEVSMGKKLSRLHLNKQRWALWCIHTIPGLWEDCDPGLPGGKK